MRTAYLVRLEEGLDRSVKAAAFYGCKHVPGVDLVVDMSIISAETLMDLLLTEDEKKPDDTSVQLPLP